MRVAVLQQAGSIAKAAACQKAGNLAVADGNMLAQAAQESMKAHTKSTATSWMSNKRASYHAASTGSTAADIFSRASALQTAVEDWVPRTEPPPKPSASALREVLMEYTLAQLDCFAPADRLLDRYQLLGPSERRKGGALLQVLECLK
jgi:hypothetical protein